MILGLSPIGVTSGDIPDKLGGVGDVSHRFRDVLDDLGNAYKSGWDFFSVTLLGGFHTLRAQVGLDTNSCLGFIDGCSYVSPAVGILI